MTAIRLVFKLEQRRHCLPAAFKSLLAARREQTAPRRIDEPRNHAGDLRKGLLAVLEFSTWSGDGTYQPAGIGVGRGVENGIHPGLFHHFSGIHNRHLIAHLRHHPEIMGDHHDAHADLFLEVEHEVQNLGLNGHIQGCGRLVRDEQFWSAGHGHGDHDPLPHPAGELMGIFVDALFRRGNSHPGKGLPGLLQTDLFGELFMEVKDFSDLLSDGVHRIEGGHGFLEDHAHFRAPQAPEHLGGFPDQVFPLKADGALGDAALGFGQQAHDREGGDAFAAAAFTQDAQGAAGFDLQADPVHSLNQAFGRGEAGCKLRDLQNFRAVHGQSLPLSAYLWQAT